MIFCGLTGVSLGCADDLLAPHAGRVEKSLPKTPAHSSALSSSLSPAAVFQTQVIPGMRRVNAINDNGIVVGDNGSNNIATAWSATFGTITVGRIDGTTQCCSALTDINNSGEAIGWSSGSGGTIPMRWSAATNTKFDPGVGGSLFGQGINAAGDFVGGEWPFRAVYKPQDGPAVVLATSAGISGAYAWDINTNRVIVGDAFVNGSMVAVYWSSPSAAAISLGTFSGPTSRAWQVSDDGDVVGVADLANGVRHAFLWTQATGKIDLSTWPNSCSGDSEAYAINNAGIIVGRCEGKPVLWTAAQGMRYLPRGSSVFGEATDINSLNQIVGTLSGGTPQGVILWTVTALPPHADAGGPYTGVEGSSISMSGAASSDPENGALTYAWNFGDPAIAGGGSGTGIAASHTYSDNGTYTVTLTVTDPTGLTNQASTTVTVSNASPIISSFQGPTDPIAVGTAIAVDGTFNDAGSGDAHTVSIDWDSNGTSTVTAGQVGAGSFTGTHSYALPGVYTLSATVTDDDNGSATAIYQYVVVFDPNAGFVTGGGWFDSPAGAYSADPSISGRANFGFISRYQKGKTTPSGQTEFQFRAANLNFTSSTYDWLVIAGRKAMYKGDGTINGAGDYGFMLTAEDGDLGGGDGKDKLRVRIWDRASGATIYDNQFAAADDADATTAIAGGSIVIHPN